MSNHNLQKTYLMSERSRLLTSGNDEASDMFNFTLSVLLLDKELSRHVITREEKSIKHKSGSFFYAHKLFKETISAQYKTGHI